MLGKKGARIKPGAWHRGVHALRALEGTGQALSGPWQTESLKVQRLDGPPFTISNRWTAIARFRQTSAAGPMALCTREINRTFHSLSPLTKDMGVDHRGLPLVVTQHGLDGPDIGAVLQELGSEGMAECVTGGTLV